MIEGELDGPEASGKAVVVPTDSAGKSSKAGQLLQFFVRVLAAEDPATSINTLKGRSKYRHWVLSPARKFNPAASIEPVLWAQDGSKLDVVVGNSGSELLIRVPAIAGAVQEAWVYPQAVSRNTNGSLRVRVEVGAATQQDISSYRSQQSAGSWKQGDGIAAFLLALGAFAYAGWAANVFCQTRKTNGSSTSTSTDGIFSPIRSTVISQSSAGYLPLALKPAALVVRKKKL